MKKIFYSLLLMFGASLFMFSSCSKNGGGGKSPYGPDLPSSVITLMDGNNNSNKQLLQENQASTNPYEKWLFRDSKIFFENFPESSYSVNIVAVKSAGVRDTVYRSRNGTELLYGNGSFVFFLPSDMKELIFDAKSPVRNVYRHAYFKTQ